jgi:hypothetical protein
VARAAILEDQDRAPSIAKAKSADLFLPLALRFWRAQFHRDLLDDFNIETFKSRDTPGMVGQQSNPLQVQVRKYLRAQSDFALGLALAVGERGQTPFAMER